MCVSLFFASFLIFSRRFRGSGIVAMIIRSFLLLRSQGPPVPSLMEANVIVTGLSSPLMVPGSVFVTGFDLFPLVSSCPWPRIGLVFVL